MDNRKSRRAALMCFCASVAFWPAVASAQDENADATFDDGTIIVTAQKREQRVQDVPVSVTALGSAQLEAAGIDSGPPDPQFARFGAW